MTYLAQAAVADNQTMQQRVAQCAAEQAVNVPPQSPDQWAYENRRTWAAAPGWDAAWESALASHPGNDTYDPGHDEAVITDQMILSQVQAMAAA